MAGPTPDSAAPPLMGPPPSGPGSKTPMSPDAGMPPPIGGGPPPSPMGMPGKPGALGDDPAKGLEDRDAIELLLEEISTLIEDKVVKDKEIVNRLLESGWSEKRFRGLSRLMKKPVKDFLKYIINAVKKLGLEKASSTVSKKLDDVDVNLLKKDKKKEEEKQKELGEGEDMGMMAPPPMEGPPPMGGPPPPPPPKLSSLDINQPDVDLYKHILKRGEEMSKKILIKDGALVEASTDVKAIINNIVSITRKAKKNVASIEDLKLKYAGIVSIKKQAIDDLMGPEEDPMDPMAGGAGDEMDIPDDLSDTEESDSVIDEIKTTVDKIDEGVDELLERGVEPGEGIMDGDIGGEDEDLGSLSDKIEEASNRTIPILKKACKEARKFLAEETAKTAGGMPPWLLGKGKDKDDKKDDKDDKDDKKKDDKDDKKKDKKKDKKDDKDDKKKESTEILTKDDLVRRVESRLKELREEKEASLYPFKKEVKPIPKVDNINAENAKQMYSTVNSEIKGQPVRDKCDTTINSELGQADLSYVKDNGTKGQKRVSIEVAEKLRKQSMEDIQNKARCAVELAAQQQLKGLVEDPLKQALVDNMKEAGIDEETAINVVYNSYIDGFQGSHQAVIKEAFDTFMDKNIDDFVKVAKFVKDYEVNDMDSVENTKQAEETEEPGEREKTASVPLRGSKVGDRRDDYKDYWKDVERERRGF